MWLGVEITEREKMTTYHTGGGWGDRITWENNDQFKTPGTHFKVVGWKQRIPQVGDILLSQFQSGLRKFKFTEVSPSKTGPSDMFFAIVVSIGYEND